MNFFPRKFLNIKKKRVDNEVENEENDLKKFWGAISFRNPVPKE